MKSRNEASLLIRPVVAALALSGMLCIAQGGRPKLYPSPDKAFVATVRPVSQGEESVVEVKSAKGQLAWRLDLHSADGEHGEVVVKAAWTPDGRFFVVSTSHAGGHSPAMHPTRFWDRRQKKAYDLARFGAEVSDAKFYVYAPDVLSTEVRNCKQPDSDVRIALVLNLRDLVDIGKLPASFPCARQ